MMSKNCGPNGVVGIGKMRDDPEALVGMMDKGDVFLADGSDRPVFTQEVQSVVGVKSALEVEGQVEVQ